MSSDSSKISSWASAPASRREAPARFLPFFSTQSSPAIFWIGMAGAASFLFLLLALAGFYANLNSSLFDLSWGDIAYHNQVFFNQTHGRSFQTSLYRLPAHGVVDNLWAYASQTAIHVNFTPFLFSPLYLLKPDMQGLYGLIFLLNYAALGFFAWRFFSAQPAADFWPKVILSWSLLASSSFMEVFQHKGHMILFSGPFFLAALDAMQRNKRVQFFFALALLCGVSEDAAMFAATACLYGVFFEKNFRPPALAGFILASLYTGLAIFVLQPAARSAMALEQASHTSYALARLGQNLANFQAHARGLLPLVLFLPAFFLPLLFMKRTEPAPWRKIAGLVLLAPLSHWVIHLFDPGTNHVYPILLCLYAAFLLSARGLALEGAVSLRRAAAAAVCFVLWCGANLVGLRANWPMPVKTGLKARLNGLGPDQRQAVRREMADRQASNRAVIQAAGALPREKSLTVWTNREVLGFVSSRSDIWMFPMYYDEVDYLLVQKDAGRAAFSFQRSPGEPLAGALARGTTHTSGENDVPVTADAARWLKEDLVDARKTYGVQLDTPHVLLLARKTPASFHMPSETVGLGWWRRVLTSKF